jgi:hypothetical protein
VITLQANKASIQNILLEVETKKKGIESVVSKSVLTAYSNAVFTITAKAFVKAVNFEAKANPKKYHHVYEWNNVGKNLSRLFMLERKYSSGGKLSIDLIFRDSRTPVPIPQQLQQAGPTGKMVKSKYIFAKKAEIMELGKPIIYRTRKNTPMLSDGKIRFVAAGTVIKNLSPGGPEVKHSLNEFLELWFTTKANKAITTSGVLKAMQNETAAILNKRGAGPQQVQSGIINLLEQYSKGEVVV